jgi:1-acyl-sn-glycerol-3-phosphate acyltransferase
MFKRFCAWLFRLKGWKVASVPPAELKKGVMIGAPHTSNWDFILMVGACEMMGIGQPRFTIKKEWMVIPFRWVLGPLGAVPIDRSAKRAGDKRPSMVDLMAEQVREANEIILLVTPEGTRSRVSRWKMGFYYVALKAEVPIMLSYLDYAKKEAGSGEVFYPTGDAEADLRKIWNFYNTITPKHPDKFQHM